MAKVLLVDDDRDLVAMLTFAITRAGPGCRPSTPARRHRPPHPLPPLSSAPPRAAAGRRGPPRRADLPVRFGAAAPAVSPGRAAIVRPSRGGARFSRPPGSVQERPARFPRQVAGAAGPGNGTDRGRGAAYGGVRPPQRTCTARPRMLVPTRPSARATMG